MSWLGAELALVLPVWCWLVLLLAVLLLVVWFAVFVSYLLRDALQRAIDRGALDFEAAAEIYAEVCGRTVLEQWRRDNPPCDVCGLSLASPDRLALCEHAVDLAKRRRAARVRS